MPTPIFNIYDASGNLVMSLANRLGKILGSRVETTSSSATISGTALGTPFVFAPAVTASDAFPAGFQQASDAAASFSGSTLSWTVFSGYSLQMIYGVF